MVKETREETQQREKMEQAAHVGSSTAMAWFILGICLILEAIVILINFVREATGDNGYMTRAFVGYFEADKLAELNAKTGIYQRAAMVFLVFDILPFMLSIIVRSKREHISLPSLCGSRLLVFFMMKACRYHIVENVNESLFVVVSAVPCLLYANIIALKVLHGINNLALKQPNDLSPVDVKEERQKKIPSKGEGVKGKQ